MQTIKKYLIILIVFFIYNSASYGSNNICGFIYDEETKEPIIGATVYDTSRAYGVVTDHNGYFCLSIEIDKFSFVVSFVGYKKGYVTGVNNNDTILQIYLRQGQTLDEVTVYGNVEGNSKSGITKISMREIKSLSGLTGEVDVMKSLQLMPGIQMGDEGSSCMIVRGGAPDQNLYLIDNTPLYYINHMGGFMSVFDINTIKQVNLYKGEFPARYSGRLSSIIDVRLKDGGAGKRQSEMMIGTLASKFFSEGPLKNKKTTYLFSARRCNLDLLMRPFSLMNSNGKEMVAYTFYDINAKLTHAINEKNKLSLLLYAGRDNFPFKEKVDEDTYYTSNYLFKGSIRWGNVLTAVNWNHVMSNKWFLSSGISYSRFFYSFNSHYEEEVDGEVSVYDDKLFSGIEDVTVKSQLNYFSNRFKFSTGLLSSQRFFKPSQSAFEVINEGEVESGNELSSYYNTELVAFLESEWSISELLNVNAGLNFNTWPVVSYYFFDPRLSINFKTGLGFDIISSYAILHQYIHMLSMNSNGLPSDIWVPSTEKLKPEKSEQISIGCAFKLSDFEVQIDSYVKRFSDLLSYKPGYSVFSGNNWEDEIETGGIGNVKGLEFLIKKGFGKHSGWVGYTLSKNTRQFKNINNNIPFPYKYDRTHELSMVYMCKISDKISFSANWIFTTGNAITLATQKYPAPNFNTSNAYSSVYTDLHFEEAHYYNGVNGYRTENYHRLDIGFDFEKKVRRGMRTVKIGFYNLYNKKNPYYYYYQTNHGQTKLYKHTLFPIIPSISYSLKF